MSWYALLSVLWETLTQPLEFTVLENYILLPQMSPWWKDIVSKEQKNRPRQQNSSVIKDGNIYLSYTSYRGATLLCGIHTLIRILTYSRQLTYAFTSWNTRNKLSFDHALSGPFNKLRSIGSQQPRLSVSALFIFISTSTVCSLLS